MKTALDIVKEVGAMQLADYDGSCPCGTFTIKGIEVDFHCWRSHRCGMDTCQYSGVHVIRTHTDVDEKDAREVGEEVVRQLKATWSHTDWTLYV